MWTNLKKLTRDGEYQQWDPWTFLMLLKQKAGIHAFNSVNCEGPTINTLVFDGKIQPVSKPDSSTE